MKAYEQMVHPIMLELWENLGTLHEFQDMGIPTEMKVQELLLQDATDLKLCFDKCHEMLNKLHL